MIFCLPAGRQTVTETERTPSNLTLVSAAELEKLFFDEPGADALVSSRLSALTSGHQSGQLNVFVSCHLSFCAGCA